MRDFSSALLAETVKLDHDSFYPVPPGQIAQLLDSTRPVSGDWSLIRLGDDRDGGYLLPDDLTGVDACFSPGVQDISTFEEEMALRGIPCFLADYSVGAPATDHPLVHFDKKFLGTSNDTMFITLDKWVKMHAPWGSDMILQMDIEGAEWGVLLAAERETLRQFRIIIFEAHGLDAIGGKFGYDIISLVFQRLLLDFHIVHIHPNNCVAPVSFYDFQLPPVMEFTLLRKDRVRLSTASTTFPHPLDVTNVPGKADFPLPECWYKSSSL